MKKPIFKTLARITSLVWLTLALITWVSIFAEPMDLVINLIFGIIFAAIAWFWHKIAHTTITRPWLRTLMWVLLVLNLILSLSFCWGAGERLLIYHRSIFG